MKPLSLAVMGIAALLATTAFAQDVVKVAPDKYKVLLENDRVRVLEYQAKSGDKTPMHSHPPYVLYSFTSGKAKFTSPDGKTTERDLKTGEVSWSNGETHATESTGGAHVLLVELKEPQTKK